MGGVFGCDHYAGQRLTIGMAERDLFFPHRNNFDTGNHGVEFLKAQRRDEGIEPLGSKFAFNLHLLAQRIGQVDIKTRGLVFATDGFKRWIGRRCPKM